MSIKNGYRITIGCLCITVSLVLGHVLGGHDFDTFLAVVGLALLFAGGAVIALEGIEP